MPPHVRRFSSSGTSTSVHPQIVYSTVIPPPDRPPANPSAAPFFIPIRLRPRAHRPVSPTRTPPDIPRAPSRLSNPNSTRHPARPVIHTRFLFLLFSFSSHLLFFSSFVPSLRLLSPFSTFFPLPPSSFFLLLYSFSLPISPSSSFHLFSTFSITFRLPHSRQPHNQQAPTAADKHRHTVNKHRQPPISANKHRHTALHPES